MQEDCSLSSRSSWWGVLHKEKTPCSLLRRMSGVYYFFTYTLKLHLML